MIRFVTIVSIAMALACGASAHAQFVDLSWSTTDGGGGHSSAGAFQLAGTIGQADASDGLTGGGYTLTGGFWPGVTNAVSSNCPGNIVNTGASTNVVNVDDLLAVIGSWGACPNPCPPRCPADIAGTQCTVNVDDLLAVISVWGPCPQ